MGALWTLKDMKYLTENYGLIENIKITEELNKKMPSLMNYIMRLGFRKYLKDEKKQLKINDWHPNRIAMLIHMYETKKNRSDCMKYTVEDMSYVLNVKSKRIYDAIYEYGLKTSRYSPMKNLTQKQLDYIKREYPTTSTLKLALELDISTGCVCRYARILKVKKRTKSKPILIKPRWSKKDTDFVINNYQTLHYTKIAGFLLKEPWCVKSKIDSLGLSEDRLKIFAKGNIRFYYTYDYEIVLKLDYINYWKERGVDSYCRQNLELTI